MTRNRVKRRASRYRESIPRRSSSALSKTTVDANDLTIDPFALRTHEKCNEASYVFWCAATATVQWLKDSDGIAAYLADCYEPFSVLGHTRRIAGLVAFLVSPQGEWVNGQVISRQRWFCLMPLDDLLGMDSGTDWLCA